MSERSDRDESDDDRRVALSCIMIFLDEVRFLDEAIRSLVDQHSTDWELLLVDDGSTDGSSDVARRWSASDARVRYFEHPGHANCGMSASRNLGLAHARGEIVGFLDGDDAWLPGTVAHIVRRFGQHDDAEALFCQTWFWNSWRRDPDAYHSDYVLRCAPDLDRGVVHRPPNVYNAMYRQWPWTMPTMCAIFVRRAALQDIGGSADEFRGMYEDHVLYSKIGLHLRVLLDDRPVALYRKRPDSASVHDPQSVQDRFLRWLADHIVESFGAPAGTDGAQGIAPAAPRPTPTGIPSVRRLRRAAVDTLTRYTPDRVRRALRSRRNVVSNSRVITHLGRVTAVPGDDVRDVWARQFLAGWRHHLTGRVLVVAPSEDPDRLIADLEVLLDGAELFVDPDGPGEAAFDHAVVIATDTCIADGSDVLRRATASVEPAGRCLALLGATTSPFADHSGHRHAVDDHSSASWERVELYGSPQTVAAIRAGASASSLSGADIERHDATAAVLVGLNHIVPTSVPV